MSQLELVQAGTMEEKNNITHSSVDGKAAADLLNTSLQTLN